MEIVAKILIGLVAVEHLYFMYFEMFAWETIGKKTFRSLPAHLFSPTKGLAANQGL
jgi:putative membrane protein